MDLTGDGSCGIADLDHRPPTPVSAPRLSGHPYSLPPLGRPYARLSGMYIYIYVYMYAFIYT